MTQPTNFLTLVQRVHALSGMSAGSLPSAVTSQTGYALKIVNWTNQAWYELQGMFDNWRFMRTEITKTLTINTSLFDVTAAPFSLSDLGRWDTDSFVVNTSGSTDKTRVTWKHYDDYKRTYELATLTDGRPTCWTQPTFNQIQFNAEMDIAYEFHARYWREPSNMAADADVPTGLPARYYMLIVHDALKKLAIDRGTNELLIEAQFNSSTLLSTLMANELEIPVVTNPVPIC